MLVAEERPHRIEVALHQGFDERSGGCFRLAHAGNVMRGEGDGRVLPRGGASCVRVPSRDEIVSFCDELLEIERFEDYGPNGLQVPGAEQVERIATGVSANLALLEAAAEFGAQLVLAHHGLFWDSGSRALSPGLAQRLRSLLAPQISLAAYHLPLDAHPEVGNNAIICERLGLERGDPFGQVKGAEIGFVGRPGGGPITATELRDRVAKLTGRDPVHYAEGPERIEAVAIVSGGGDDTLEDAAIDGLDALVTGEVGEPSLAIAREYGIHFFAAGHHATETFGIERLGELLAERFSIEHRFIDIENPA